MQKIDHEILPKDPTSNKRLISEKSTKTIMTSESSSDKEDIAPFNTK